MKKVLLSLLFATLALLASRHTALASEGDFVLSNRIGTDARCLARSVWLDQYNILVNCENISYPSGTYAVWVQPSDGGNPQTIGNLDYGKRLFKTKTTFSSIFVTLEETDKPRTPSGTVIMSGSKRNFNFRTGESTAPTNELGTPGTTPTPVPVGTNQSGSIFRIFAAGGLLAFLALFGIILVIFVITRR